MNDQPRMMNDYTHHKYNQISICVDMWKNWYQNEAVWYSSIPMRHVTEDVQLPIKKAFTLNSLSTAAELAAGYNAGQRWNQIYLYGSV